MSFYDHAMNIFERQYNCTFKLFNLQAVSQPSDSPVDDPYDKSEWVEIFKRPALSHKHAHAHAIRSRRS